MTVDILEISAKWKLTKRIKLSKSSQKCNTFEFLVRFFGFSAFWFEKRSLTCRGRDPARFSLVVDIRVLRPASTIVSIHP